jgi:hypothetical protein
VTLDVIVFLVATRGAAVALDVVVLVGLATEVALDVVVLVGLATEVTLGVVSVLIATRGTTVTLGVISVLVRGAVHVTLGVVVGIATGMTLGVVVGIATGVTLGVVIFLVATGGAAVTLDVIAGLIGIADPVTGGVVGGLVVPGAGVAFGVGGDVLLGHGVCPPCLVFLPYVNNYGEPAGLRQSPG